MRLSTLILPVHGGAALTDTWRRAEMLGLHAAYTYDHLTWRDFRERPWFAAVPTLAAASVATDRVRLGTLVASPNFRHPVTLAKELLTLDHLSGGRVTAGLGAGGTGFDATALGQDAWTPAQRADRFDEFVRLLDTLLTQPATTTHGRYYSAVEARTVPDCVQGPRLPFLVAATGPRGIALAAELGQGWVTYGSAGPPVDDERHDLRAVASQVARLEEGCRRAGRDPEAVDKVLLGGFTAGRPLDSVDAFVAWAGAYGELGITEVVVHWPVPDSRFAVEPVLFERIVTEGRAQLR